jgi:hypothetical protein
MMDKVSGRGWFLELGTSENLPCYSSLYAHHSTSLRPKCNMLTLLKIFHYRCPLISVYQSSLRFLISSVQRLYLGFILYRLSSIL